MSVLFVLLPCHHHPLVVRVVGQQFPSLPRITDGTVNKTPNINIRVDMESIGRYVAPCPSESLTLQAAGLTLGGRPGQAIAALRPDAPWSPVTKRFLQSGRCSGRSEAASLMAQLLMLESQTHTYTIFPVCLCELTFWQGLDGVDDGFRDAHLLDADVWGLKENLRNSKALVC